MMTSWNGNIFPRYWPFMREIHRSPVNSPHKGQWRRALIFSLVCAWINGWANNHEDGDLRRHRAHYGVTRMIKHIKLGWLQLLRDFCVVIYEHFKMNDTNNPAMAKDDRENLYHMHDNPKSCRSLLQVIFKYRVLSISGLKFWRGCFEQRC